jgi:hypothetical protein
MSDVEMVKVKCVISKINYEGTIYPKNAIFMYPKHLAKDSTSVKIIEESKPLPIKEIVKEIAKSAPKDEPEIEEQPEEKPAVEAIEIKKTRGRK